MGKLALLRYLGEVSAKRFVVLSVENSKSNHLGAQGTFNLKLKVGASASNITHKHVKRHEREPGSES